MSGWPATPVVYEIDTWPWLAGMSRRSGRPVSLGNVPGEVWDEVAAAGVDAVWLMGVWERSPAGLAVALNDDGLWRDFQQALPDLRREDVVGSPYCVRRYVVDHRLGGPDGLAAARDQLRRRGLRLVLDYVPNHVAPDHAAITANPEWFVNGADADLAADRRGWFEVGDRVIAHGRDPYFPPWPDVAQLNAFDPGLRGATAETLIDIAGQCDGVRCDMAMLLTNEVFARTWGRWAGAPPADEFWPGVIENVRAAAGPDFVFVAEAYWDMEWVLQQQGFDFCYDKRLYDRLVGEDADAVRRHLSAGLDYQNRLIRFIENHDEPRAAAALPGARGRAAAMVIATVPGATLWHDGQFDGRRIRLPVFLSRAPGEPVDEELRVFYRRLVEVAAAMTGEWRLLESEGWPDNASHRDVLAWSWQDGQNRHVVALNFSGHPAQARIRLPWPTAGSRWRLTELLDGRVLDRDGAELAAAGLYVDLPPWEGHFLQAHPLVN
jgi:hypothetical protein